MRPRRRAGSIAVEAKLRDDFGQVARSHSTACSYLESLQRVPLRLHAATFIDCRRAPAEKKTSERRRYRLRLLRTGVFQRARGGDT